MTDRIRFRRKPAAEWAAVNAVLPKAEAAYESDTGKWKVGDGVAAWNDLGYQPSAVDLDAVSLAATTSDLTADLTAPTTWSAATTLLTKAAMTAAVGSTTVYSPWVVDATGISGAPGKYLAYWSTDHASGAGGVSMAWANDPVGPWTINSGFVYQDTVAGTQSETPCVVKNFAGTGLVMYYHQRNLGATLPSNGVQTTMHATSTDGVTWTRGGVVVLPGSTFSRPGDGHTGYFRCHRTNEMLIGWSLYGGTNFSRMAVWYSRDGVNWAFGRYMSHSSDITGSLTLRLKLLPVVFQWRGEWWAAFNVSSPAAGGATPATSSPFMAQIDRDFQSLVTFPQESNFNPACVIKKGATLYGYSITSAGLVLRTIGA